MNRPKLIKEWMIHSLRLMILIYLNNNEKVYISSLRRKLKISMIGTWKNLKYLKEKELIDSSFKFKNKRKKFIYLTDKGKLIAGKLNELDLLLSSI